MPPASKKNSLIQTPETERAALPRFRPRIVFAQPGGSGTRGEPIAGRSILIVEDDFLIAQQIQHSLTKAGYEIVGVATSAEEAISFAQASSPDLVLMDIRLAGARDGVDVALELYANLGIRCLFVTAHHDQATRLRAAAAAPIGWVAKPFVMAVLIKSVRSALAALDGE